MHIIHRHTNQEGKNETTKGRLMIGRRPFFFSVMLLLLLYPSFYSPFSFVYSLFVLLLLLFSIYNGPTLAINLRIFLSRKVNHLMEGREGTCMHSIKRWTNQPKFRYEQTQI